jgi:hypothetical protein
VNPTRHDPLDPEGLLDLHPAVRDVAARVRRIVRDALGAPEERVRPGWVALTYHDEQAGYVCGIFPRAEAVRLLFEHGASLADPEEIFDGGGVQTRHITLHPGQDVPEAAIREMIGRAVLYGAVR